MSLNHLRCALLLALLVVFASCRSGDEADGGAQAEVGVEMVVMEADPSAGDAFVPVLDGPLRVLGASPRGALHQIRPGQGIAVTLSRPVAPLGDTPPPPDGLLTLDPAVPGTLAWEGTQTLIFRPAEPLPAATAFTATLAAGAASLDGTVLAEPFSWTFETPRPRLTGSSPADGALYVTPSRAPIRLAFSLPVGASAQPFVRLQYATGGAVDVQMEQQAPDTLTLRPLRALRAGTRYRIVLEAGLPTTAGPLGMASDQVVSFSTYGEPRLTKLVQDANWRTREADFRPNKPITFLFSNPVSREALLRSLTFEPAVPLEDAPSDAGGGEDVAHRLSGFAPETAYRYRISGLTDAFGQTLSTSGTFRTVGLEPGMRVAEGLLVMEIGQAAQLPIQTTNLQTVRYGAKRLSPEEVIARGKGWRWTGGDDLPLSRRLDVSGPRNQIHTAPLDVGQIAGPNGGFVALRLDTPDDQTDREWKALAQVTSLGVTAKFSPQNQLVLVTTLQDAAPVAGAEVEIRDADARVLWTGTTDGSGRAEAPGWADLGVEKENRWNAPSLFAFVQHRGHQAFASSRHTEGIEPWRYGLDVDWSPEEVQRAASLFTDRGLYRAGERAHLKAIVREKGAGGAWRVLRDSIRVLVTSPRDETVLDRTFQPSSMGTFDFSYSVPESAVLGPYVARVVLASDTAAHSRSWYEQGDLAQLSFRVEAFRSATFAVGAEPALPAATAGDFFEATLSGRYLYGSPMAGARVRYALVRRPGSYRPPGYAGYTFGSSNRYAFYSETASQYERVAERDTLLSREGERRVRFALPPDPSGSSSDLQLTATVTDPSGQEVSAQRTVPVHPGAFYLGVKPQTGYLDLDQSSALTADLIAVDPNGQPAEARGVQVRLVRRQWNSVREVGPDGRLRWRSEQMEEVVAEQTVDLARGRRARLTLPVAEGGAYVVQAEGTDVRGNRIRTGAHVYAAGGQRSYVGWQREDDERLELVPEKTSYAPGETARLLVPSPFETATALVTVEREGILSSRVVELSGSAPQIEIPLTEQHLPNAFVSVILLSGRVAQPTATEDLGGPQFRAGYAELSVDPGVRHLKVEVDAPEQARPGDEVEVALRLVDHEGRGVAGEVAFSAADRGVLDLIGYRLPDPFDAFYGPRALAVSTAETRAHLVRQRSFGEKEEDLGGGGGDPDALMRRDFRPLAHWAPALKTGRDGRVSVRFRLPESLTTFRLMAAAATADHRFGRGETELLVTQPLVLTPALPRFARRGDQFQAGVLVANRTDRAGDATVRIEAAGGSLRGASEQTVRLEPGETRAVRFPLATPDAGAVRYQFRARLGDERDAFETRLLVERPAVREVSAAFRSLDAAGAGAQATEGLQIPPDAVPGLGRLDVRLSSTALVGLDGAADYLFRYPYGCLEQQTSRIRPLLVAQPVIDAFGLDTAVRAALGADRRETVQAYLAGLQTYWTGDGFALWEGGRHVNPYVTAYTVLTLADARRAGFALPDVAGEAVDALEQMVRRSDEKPRYYSPAVWNQTRALALLALARHGRVLDSEISALAAQVLGRTDQSAETEATLLRLAAMAGLPLQAQLRERLQSRVVVEGNGAYLQAADGDGFGWIFASDTRATAHGLAALVETDAADPDTRPLAEQMVRRLVASRQGGHWATTQDNAAVLDALVRFYEAFEAASPALTGQVRLAGRQIAEAQFSGRSLTVTSATAPASALPSAGFAPVTVQARGRGRLYYDLRLTTFRAGPVDAEQRGLTVQRQIQPLDDRGEPAGPAQTVGRDPVALPPGQLVRVTLRLTSPTDRHYVVVDDALPAGLEPLNPAFQSTDRQLTRGEGSGAWWGSFTHTEFRTERVTLFADYLRAGDHPYTYLARVSTPGQFVYPPATAEAMYDPAISGRTASSVLVVQ